MGYPISRTKVAKVVRKRRKGCALRSLGFWMFRVNVVVMAYMTLRVDIGGSATGLQDRWSHLIGMVCFNYREKSLTP